MAKKDNSKQIPEDVLSKLPKEAQERIKKVSTKLEKFKKQTLEQFKDYVVGMALLPPPQQPGPGAPGMPPGPMPAQPQLPPGSPDPKDMISVLVLIDDSDSKQMAKLELRQKIAKILDDKARKIDKNLYPSVVLISELWASCFDQKYDIVRLISMSHTIYDKGMLAAVKISEIHKSMVIRKFDRYIVSYVLAGSIVQGRSTAESDVDVFIVIDDTDVKRMTRYELKEKLRAIIISMGIEAGEITGIRNKLNIQVYILTDFWESVREANPIIFTFLRDGVPLHDTGIFLPWKQLLKLGKIRPSPEAIDLYAQAGDQLVARIKQTFNHIGMEDTYWAILTPSQAALMLYGIPPPTPRETSELMREIFVKKEKILEEKYVKILEKNIQVRKDIEHQKIKFLSGAEADKLLTDADEYLNRLKKLFTTLRDRKEKEDIAKDIDSVITLLRDVLNLEGISYSEDSQLVAKMKSALVDTSKIESKYHKMFTKLLTFQKEYAKGKATKADIANGRKDINALIKRLNEHIQMLQGQAVNNCKIHIRHDKKFGEVLLLEKKAFVIFDLEAKDKEVTVAKYVKGKLTGMKKSSLEEMDKAIAEEKLPEKAYICKDLFEDLKKVFGKDYQILVRK